MIFQDVERTFVEYEKKLIKFCDVGQELQDRLTDEDPAAVSEVVDTIEAIQDRYDNISKLATDWTAAAPGPGHTTSPVLTSQSQCVSSVGQAVSQWSSMTQ